jgi:periplasmic divalent cation tolerance protein
MTDIRYLYVTTKDQDEARKIAHKVLEARLAACANILPQMKSMYWWHGVIQYESESVLILKTRADKVEEATQVVKQWHSYSTPCILSLPIDGGDEAYLNWLRGEVIR